jgi:hypothetical protein
MAADLVCPLAWDWTAIRISRIFNKTGNKLNWFSKKIVLLLTGLSPNLEITMDTISRGAISCGIERKIQIPSNESK